MNNNNKLITKAAAVLMGMATIVRVAFYEAEMPLLYHSLRGNSRGKHSLYIPTSLDSSAQRRLSIDLGGGACEWQPPEYEIPNDIDFFKTLIAGFPSCDKRMTFIQMEALTGWAAVDEWDLYRGYSNHPFIKSNYPHHEGIWSWGSQVDQVVMVVRNIRRTMVEYHDILWDIATAKNSGVSDVEVLYKYAPPISSFFKWRDARVIDEISWYGWFIGALNSRCLRYLPTLYIPSSHHVFYSSIFRLLDGGRSSTRHIHSPAHHPRSLATGTRRQRQ